MSSISKKKEQPEAQPLVVVTKDEDGAHRVYGPFATFNAATKKRRACSREAKKLGRKDEAFVSPMLPASTPIKGEK